MQIKLFCLEKIQKLVIIYGNVTLLHQYLVI